MFSFGLMMFTAIISLLCFSLSASAGKVPSPQNVRVKSFNMGLVLEWDPPQKAPGNISQGGDYRYTTEYKGWHLFDTACVNISSLSCDFTNLVTPFVIFMLRVRAELNGESSDWVETEQMSLEEKSIIGAPDVRLQSRSVGIEVDITEPVLKKSNLKEIFSPISFRILYWSTAEDKKEMLVDQSSVMLTNLKPNVQYCVQAQIILDNRTSLMSNVSCKITSPNDQVNLWQIMLAVVVSFLVTAAFALLIAFAAWSSYRGIRYLHPRAKLPEHFKQYLLERPKSPMLLAMQNITQPKELYYQISIITAPETPECM
ncbi:interleukin-10 receptor subunit beta-like [Trichomycterus rosablanca]|uniref:interleukin-10 receptor subunit beta-like n=1 Tax=Trichomycterus rosablanca TaxID=2290929 RepID=UPI002F352D40